MRYDLGVNKIIFIAMFLLALAGQAQAQGPGRTAVIHLADGTQLKCVILSYSDSKFHIDVNGEERTVDIASVSKVAFGEAVGEHVRGPLDPPGAHDPAAAPAGLERTDVDRRGIEELSRSPAPRLVIWTLWSMTGGLQDADRAAKVEEEIQPRLKTARAEGKVREEKNLRLSLVILKMIQQQRASAKELLDALKKDYPDDPVLRNLTMEQLAKNIARWHGFEPDRFPRRPPRERPGLPREGPPPPPEPRS